MSSATKSSDDVFTFEARGFAAGNGTPEAGDYGCENGRLYRVVRTYGYIETSGQRGNWVRCDVEHADWDDLEDGAEPEFSIELGDF